MSCSWMLLLDTEHMPRDVFCWRHPRLLLGECLWECKADRKGHLVICARGLWGRPQCSAWLRVPPGSSETWVV